MRSGVRSIEVPLGSVRGGGRSLKRSIVCKDCEKDKKQTSSAQGTRAVLNRERRKTEGQRRIDRRRGDQGEKITL